MATYLGERGTITYGLIVPAVTADSWNYNYYAAGS
jgi:hypothetical protein